MEKWNEKKANGRRLFTKLVALGLAIGIIAISTLSGIPVMAAEKVKY